MTRTLQSTSYGDQRAEFVYLYIIHNDGGVLYLTNAPEDILFDGNTYVALGGQLIHEAVEEQNDRRGQSVRLHLFGVDQTIISTILSNQFRGQPAFIYMAHFDPDTGVMETPDLIWRGRQMGDFEFDEDRSQEDSDGGQVEVSTTIASILSTMARIVAVKSNVTSHQSMLERAGLPTTDTFFERVNKLEPVTWGTEQDVLYRGQEITYRPPLESGR